MLNKFTFEKKLGIDSSKKEFNGLKVAMISALIAFTGWLLAAFGPESLGITIFFIGFGGVAIGMLIHFFYMFKKIFNYK